ncbi:hypothetical protein GCM10023323_17290 [Streptomyces thinghirensis]|uniref:Uncharacterized protein n=1 Tax=Streptomyces thinghirensis TaxID=551547 RepID=A0ABP9T168_9ACTN
MRCGGGSRASIWNCRGERKSGWGDGRPGLPRFTDTGGGSQPRPKEIEGGDGPAVGTGTPHALYYRIVHEGPDLSALPPVLGNGSRPRVCDDPLTVRPRALTPGRPVARFRRSGLNALSALNIAPHRPPTTHHPPPTTGVDGFPLVF